jgi:predicted hydrocarbon binding protein
LQKLPFATFKYASVDALRSFLEITLKQYLRKIGEEPSTSGKFTFLESALKKLKEIEERSGGSAEIAQNVGFLLSDKVLLDAANHNPSYIAVEQEIKDVADKTIRVLEYIFEKYQNDKNQNTTQISSDPS